MQERFVRTKDDKSECPPHDWRVVSSEKGRRTDRCSKCGKTRFIKTTRN